MVKKELVEYLRQKVSEGYSAEQVEDSLRQKGYSESEIGSIMRKVVVNERIKITSSINFPFQKYLVPLIVLIAAIIALAFVYSLFNIEKAVEQADYREFTIVGSSMLPTLHDGEKVMVDQDFYLKNGVKRGDIVKINLKVQQQPIVKRVIAVGGDKVEFKEGRIFLNDKPLEEPYLYDMNVQTPSNINALLIPLKFYNGTIPKKTVLVLGDNRASSKDSTEFGLLPEDYVDGKVILKP